MIDCNGRQASGFLQLFIVEAEAWQLDSILEIDTSLCTHPVDNGGQGGCRFWSREEWNRHGQAFVHEMRGGRPAIAGDGRAIGVQWQRANFRCEREPRWFGLAHSEDV